MAPTVSFIAKHAFAGDVRQAQISFPQGAILTAKAGQEGNAWWWGSYSGREGWFPPAYVTAAPQQSAAAFSPQNEQSMQQKMQQVTFTSSVQQQQQVRQVYTPNPLIPQSGYQQQQPVAGFGQPAATGFGPQPGFGVPTPAFRIAESDPFAGLDLAPVPAMPSFQNRELPAPTFTGSHPLSGGQMSMAGMPPASTVGATKPPVVLQQRAAPPASPASPDSTAAAMARLGISTTTTSKTASNQKKSSPANAASVAQTRVASPIPAPVKALPQGQPTATTTRSAVPADSTKPVSLDEAEAKRRREQEQAAIKAQMRKEKEELTRQQATIKPTQGGIGSSGVVIDSSNDEAVETGLGIPSTIHSSSSTFNPYDFLAGTDGQLPNRRFSPIYRVPPFWAMMGLDTYIRRSPVPQEKSKDIAGMYEQLAKALSFVCHVVAESDNLTRTGRGRFGLGKSQQSSRSSPLAFLRSNHMACEAWDQSLTLCLEGFVVTTTTTS